MAGAGRALGLCGALLIAGAAAGGDWTFYRHDAFGTSNAQETFTQDQAKSLKQLWVSDVHGIIANPIVANGRLFVTSADGSIKAVDAASGRVLWSHAMVAHGPFHCFPDSTSSSTKGPVGAPAVVGNRVFMPGGDGVAYAFDAASGTKLWSTQIANVAGSGDFLWSSAFPLNGRVYFGVASLHDCVLVPGRVVALDQASGAVVGTWHGDAGYGSGAGVWTQPAYDSRTNRMFLTTGTIAEGLSPSQQPLADAFVALDPGSMATVDHFTPISAGYFSDFDFGASPVLYDTSDGTHWIAATNKNGFVYALDRDHLANGVRWTFQISGAGASPDIGESSISSPAYANGLVFVAGGKTSDGFGGAVAALDGATGKPKWLLHPPNGGFVLAAPTVAGNTLIFSATKQLGQSGSALYVVDQATGAVLYTFPTAGAQFAEPTFANGVLYVGDLAGNLWALGPSVSGGGGADGGTGGGTDGGTSGGSSSASDSFNRSGSLGANWKVASGAFSANGSAAVGTASQSYAFWNSAFSADVSVSVQLSTPIRSTYAGVTARALSASPAADHYAAYVMPDGTIGLARRQSWNYTYLGTGPVMPSGTHVLTLVVSGSFPVTLSVQLDGAEVIHATDSDAAALTSGGLAGIFDYSGASWPLDNFAVTVPGGSVSDGGTSGGGTDAGTVDAGSPDAGAPDSGTPDAGTADAGTPDAGTTDAGTPDGGVSDGGSTGGVAFEDTFDRSGALGANWSVAHGAFSDNGSAAIGTAAQSYAFWTGSPDPDATVSAIVPPANGTSYVGVIARASSTPDGNHYAAYVGPDGTVALARRNSWTYSYLATGPKLSATTHRLALTATGANPVILTVTVDGTQVIRATDSSSGAFTTAGRAGIFDYNGASRPVDDFIVSGTGGTTDTGGGSVGGTDGGTSSATVRSDDFTSNGSLGSGWTVWSGGFSVSSGTAVATASRSYATMGSALAGDMSVSATVDPKGVNYVGVLARANPNSGAQDHYVGWLDANGAVHIARANSWSYTYLGDANAGLTGPHRLRLQVRGTGPVQLTLFVDDQPVIDLVDSSSSALTGAGTVGLFSWQSGGPTFQHFEATQP